MEFNLSEPLSVAVARAYEHASANGSLHFSPTKLRTIWTESGIPFQLRYCPSLGKKPKQNDEQTISTKKPDPFANPPPELFIGDLPNSKDPSHILVLNKFPVIAEHFILATKTNKAQTDVLEPDDIEVAHACLTEWSSRDSGKNLFAFFNSGEHSGASQPHRHLQFLPVESMHAGDEEGKWEVLTERLASRPDKTSLPFVCFQSTIPSNATGQRLHEIYLALLLRATNAMRAYMYSSQGKSIHSSTTIGQGPALISYNMAMTNTSMMVAPRTREGAPLKDQNGQDLGFVALNGTVLGGTLMVKTEDEWNIMKQEGTHLDDLLRKIGIPSGAVDVDHEQLRL